jgi:drug/metabolite transporter (DMT)-like permease
MDDHVLGLASLNLVTIIWGSQHALIKDVVVHSELPSLLNAMRFLIAATIAICTRLLCRPCATGFRYALLRAGAELGVWQCLGFTLQLIGLHWTTASRSAFLLYLNAPLVPIFSWMLGERRIGLRSWGSTCTHAAARTRDLPCPTLLTRSSPCVDSLCRDGHAPAHVRRGASKFG